MNEMLMNNVEQIFPPDFEEIIDFTIVQEMIRKLCTSQTGKERSTHFPFYTDVEEIQFAHKPIREILEIIDAGNILPHIEFANNRDDIAFLRTNGWVLDIEHLYELLFVFNALRDVRQFVQKQQLSIDSVVKQIVNRVEYHVNIHKEIQKIFDEKGNISDRASDELYRIRQAIKSKVKEIDKRVHVIFKQLKVQGVLEEDASLTIRNGRNVLPVPASMKYQVKGIIHDESATGLTAYIEPLEIVEMNNQLKETEAAEKREIRKILASISALLQPFINDVLEYYNILGEIDIIFAKAKFARKYNAFLPDVSGEAMINWKQARNLVLQINLEKQQKKIIPFDLEMGNRNRMLVLSGANAGGKSVVLKTVALNQYMIQCGLPVSISPDSQAGVFTKICMDIGDGQSFETNLSTYTSHLEKVSKILELADERTLYLIDEIGSGTDPILGGAMAQSILINLHTKGSRGIVTTHIDVLKEMADTMPEVQNAAMMFDMNKLEPSFQMKTGVPGNSFTFEIAARTGIPENIIMKAKELSGKERISLEERISDFERASTDLQQKLQEVQVAEVFFSEIVEKYQNLIKRVESEQKVIIEQTKEEAITLITNANQLIEKTIREIKESQAEKSKTKDLRKNLAEFKNKASEFVPAKQLPEKLKKNIKPQQSPISESPISIIYTKGMCVKMKGSEKTGIVLEVLGKDTLRIAFDTVQLSVNAGLVEYVGDTHGLLHVGRNIRLNNDLLTRVKMFERNIDVRGMRADEVESLLDKHLDEAVLVGIKEFSVLHGKGYGILRQIVKKVLQSHNQVEEFYNEHVEKGGEGITIVKMK